MYSPPIHIFKLMIKGITVTILSSSVLVKLCWTELALLSLYPSDPAGRPAVDPEKYPNLLKTGLIWFGTVWYGLAWFGIEKYGLVWFGTV